MNTLSSIKIRKIPEKLGDSRLEERNKTCTRNFNGKNTSESSYLEIDIRG
jgi:hypothetical protein